MYLFYYTKITPVRAYWARNSEVYTLIYWNNNDQYSAKWESLNGHSFCLYKRTSCQSGLVFFFCLPSIHLLLRNSVKYSTLIDIYFSEHRILVPVTMHVWFSRKINTQRNILFPAPVSPIWLPFLNPSDPFNRLSSCFSSQRTSCCWTAQCLTHASKSLTLAWPTRLTSAMILKTFLELQNLLVGISGYHWRVFFPNPLFSPSLLFSMVLLWRAYAAWFSLLSFIEVLRNTHTH